MTPDTVVFVNTDWSGVEARLTAFFSGDTNLTEALANELKGGHKVHALNAHAIYGCDPGDAKTTPTKKGFQVNLQGTQKDAYDAGKRLTHAWNYGMSVAKMVEQFWIPMREAVRIDEALSAKYPQLVQWRKDLVNEVCGIALYACNTCGSNDTGPSKCVAHAWQPIRQFVRWEQEPTYHLSTPFGRRRWFFGRRGEIANAAVAQKPQSCGASMWNYSLQRLHGLDTLGGGWWPTPDVGVLRCPTTCVPTSGYSALLSKTAGVDVATGTYDSFLLRTLAKHLDVVVPWVLWTVEQAWPQLGNWRFPAEYQVGQNWGKYHEHENPQGLKDQPYRPLTAEFGRS